VTGDLLNWDEIYSKLKRIDYGGVMRSFAGKFEFTRAARDVIRNDFLKKGIASAPKLIWEERNDEWVWEEVLNYVLDISSYSDDGGVLSISAIDDSVESIIKANKGTQYEYVVEDISEIDRLYYDGLGMMNSVSYLPAKIDLSDDINRYGYWMGYNQDHTIGIPFSVNGSEIANKGLNLFTFDSRISRGYYPAKDNYMFRAEKEIDIHISGEFKVLFQRSGGIASLKFGLYTIPDNDKTKTPISDIYTIDGNGKVFEFTFKINKNVRIIGNLLFIAEANFETNTDANLLIYDFRNFDISLETTGRPVYMDVVYPVKLLNRLVQSMNGGKEGLIGEIVFDGSDRMNGCKLVAAESIRGISSAKMYTSFTKFCNWMSAVFGYVYEVDGKTIRFKHRTAFYEKEVAIDLGGDVSEFNGSIVSSLIYSRVRAGYDKQDYDSVNGRDEFRFTTEYSTETTLTDNKLDLISPYRADVYGVEFLVQRRGEDTTDSNSDNDVFFICTQYVSETNMTPEGIVIRSSRYELDRSIGIVGVLSPDTMFNVMYSPRSFLIANKAFIGVSTNKLSYASSDGNSEVVIDGVSEKDAFVIEKNKALFMPFEVTIETNIQDFPSNRKGLVRVKNDGYVYSGFIEEAETFHGKSKSNGYKLLVNEIVEEK
ncbi:MAG: hypothetical protein RR550_02980, partial [Rikenellaceae bacterium]